MNEFQIILKVKTNSSNKTDIGKAVVHALLTTDIVTSIEDINITTVEERPHEQGRDTHTI